MSDTPLLNESKFYTMAQTHTLLAWLIPSIDVKMITEDIVSTGYPRDAEDNNALRIFIQYINTDDNSILFKLVGQYDVETTKYKIDEFLNGYVEAIGVDNLPDDPQTQFEFILLEALTYAISVVIGIESIGTNENLAKQVCTEFLGCAITTLYGNPSDVYIVTSDTVNENHDDIFGIKAMWLMKSKN